MGCGELGSTRVGASCGGVGFTRVDVGGVPLGLLFTGVDLDCGGVGSSRVDVMVGSGLLE